nr:SDR family NAD(P)-dependent oxidoreductase [Legionella tunisiensis]
MRLKNKVAIVTGAASGIGKEIAIVYAREGAKVAIADLNLNQAQQVADEIQSMKYQAMAVEMDVTDEEQVTKGVDAVAKHFGGVDVLVSNAGIQIIDPVDKLSFANWKKCLLSI